MAVARLSYFPSFRYNSINTTHHYFPCMATFSFSHYSLLITAHHDHPLLRPRPRCSLSCRSRKPTEPTGGGGGGGGGRLEKEEKRKEEKRLRSYWWTSLGKVFSEAGKMGKGVKESLSPKQKGDWKDLLLMSFAFAVYVYISQMIVCAYCAWMAMLNNY